MPIPKEAAKHSDNPAVRIAAHQTSQKQPDTISERRIKLHACHGSLDVDSVEGLLADAVADGELEEVAGEEDVFRVVE